MPLGRSLLSPCSSFPPSLHFPLSPCGRLVVPSRWRFGPRKEAVNLVACLFVASSEFFEGERTSQKWPRLRAASIASVASLLVSSQDLIPARYMRICLCSHCRMRGRPTRSEVTRGGSANIYIHFTFKEKHILENKFEIF